LDDISPIKIQATNHQENSDQWILDDLKGDFDSALFKDNPPVVAKD